MTIKPGWQGRVYEDFEVGDVYPHPLGRTVTQNDNIWFSLLTMNTNPIHFDSAYATQTEWGTPLVNSALTLSLDIGQDSEPQTQALYAAYEAAQKSIGPSGSIENFLTALTPLIDPITKFFDKVLVMHEDQAIRQTRQALLQRIWHLADGIVDLTKVEGF